VGGIAVTFDDYDAIDAINHSTLKHIAVSPLKYRHVVDNGIDDTALFGVGRAIHAAVLQPERLSIDFAIYEGKRRSGKAWDKFEADNAGLTILKRDEWDGAMAAADKVKNDPVAAEWLNLGKALIERPIRWVDKATGLTCKGRPDSVHSAIVDLKGTNSIDERVFRALATRMSYFGQLAFYRRGYHALTNLWLPCADIAVEMDPPYDVGVFVVDDESLRVADDKISRLLAKVAECRKTGVWPGRYQKAQTMTLPDWAREESDYNFGEAA
jgi:hypothetical protein